MKGYPPMNHPRLETPDPLHTRPRWRSLNGPWEFAVDDETAIRPSRRPGDRSPGAPDTYQPITVPFCPQSRLSGVGLAGHHPVLWYRRDIAISPDERTGRIILRFGAVDFAAEVWINGSFVGGHQGGYTPFSVDITRLVDTGSNRIELRVEDRLDREQPRGKQSWQAPFVCWYGECSGIWQPVWLEFLPRQGIADLSVEATLRPGTASGHLRVRVSPFSPGDGEVTVAVTHRGTPVAQARQTVAYPSTDVDLTIDPVEPWSPDHPALYDLEVTLAQDGARDRVDSYAGFRTVGLRDGMLTINGAPVYQRLVLIQGIWSDGYYTAPTDEDFRRDIELAQAMGFNGCRMHSKIEDPRFYYWADRLGFLVWEELASPYRFTAQSREHVLRDTREMIRRDRGHPSVVAWTLYNESWGVPDIAESWEEQRFVRELVEAVRQLDPTRLVVANDGWELVGGDIYGIHSYAATPEELAGDLETLFAGDPAGITLSAGGPPMSNGKQVVASPDLAADRLYMLTEFGGIGLATVDRSDAWGYDTMASSPEELRRRMAALIETVRRDPRLGGYVYTQLTDVEQEVNGLLTADRRPKIPVEDIRAIILA